MPTLPFYHPQPASHKRKKAYKIGIHLGEGGYGEVKQATRLADGLQVAIKIIPKVHVKDLEEQIKRQDSLQGLKHDHIIHLFEWWESTTKFYLAFELAAGGELYDHLISQSAFDEGEAKEVVYALVDAVKYLHDRNIIHRDLKPENILYRTPPGTNGVGHDDCVVSDFGLALKLDSSHQVLHTHCGSPGYSAPEVYSPEGYSLPADMWSIGIIVFALMGGRFPYKEVEPRALAEEARTTKLYFPEKPWDTISESAKHFIQGLLRVNPKKRFTAAQALDHPWLRTAISRPASPNHGSTTPTAKTADSLFSSSHPALERLKISASTPIHPPNSTTPVSASSSSDHASCDNASTPTEGTGAILERRATAIERTTSDESAEGSGTHTPMRIGGRGDATEFPPLEKRETHIGDEDEAVIL